MTGSSSSLGVYLLDTLLKDPRVSRIICLNRSSSAAAEKTQIALAKSRGLDHDFPSSRVTFLQYSVFSPRLGLSLQTYTNLLKSVTHILHSAWSVDSNRSLSTMEP